MKTKYSIGNEVQSISNPSRIGAIVEIGPVHADIQYYRVNFGGDRPMIPEVDLQPYHPGKPPPQNLIDGYLAGYSEFQRLMTYQRLLRDYPLRNNIYAFNASRIRFLPYQFKPLLKFLDSPHHRLLLADEVGLGKTIEAGLILTELRARQNVERVLIVCPSNLKTKWYFELKRRFGEDFAILDSQRFLRFLDDYEDSPERTKLQGIISLETIRQTVILNRLDELSPSFDLVIVDEAHHMRNPTKQRQAGVHLSHLTGSMLMLTATPVHLGNENLFSLLNILDEEDFPDFVTVGRRFQINEPIILSQICLGQIPPKVEKAIELLKKEAQSPWIIENPLYREILDSLNDIQTSIESKIDYKKLLIQSQKNLAELNLIGHIFTRTRKREVQENFVGRHAFSIRLKFTEIEQRFYQAVTEFVRTESRLRTASPLIQQWMLNTPQRRVASCIPAMVKYYKTHLGFDSDDLPEDLELSEESESIESLEKSEFQQARQNLQNIIASWPENEPDSKYEEFIKILREIEQQDKKSKVIIFAFFKDTLRYLTKRLKEDGFTAVLITGDVDTDERVKIIEKFKDDPNIKILLSSRVGSEGLDFQFCDTLFNYDLPWNPMEVEQRIGRLDRIGQESRVIRIFNFWIEGTIEQRILDRLYERIHIFERSVGELEMILGDEIRNLERDLLSKSLTPAEEEERIERASVVIMSRLTELEKLESESAKFIGTDQYFDEEVQMIKDRRRYITGEQLYRFFVDFIRNTCPRTRLEYDNSSGLGCLYPDEQLRSFISQHWSPSELVRFMNPSKGGIPITFDSQTAFNKPQVEFINILHPLTQAILDEYRQNISLLQNAHYVILKTNQLSPGYYFYFVFRLRIHAERGENTLEMVLLDENLKLICSLDNAEMILAEMVEKGQEPKKRVPKYNIQHIKKIYESAQNIFGNHIVEVRKKVERNNDLFIDRRLLSLKAFYNKNITKQKDLLEKGIKEQKQERYLRMRERWRTRLERELDTKIKQLESKRTIGVEYDEISAGILEVVN